MHLGFITGNILQKFSKQTHNIIYFQQDNLFDHMIYSIDNNYYLLNNNRLNYDINNVIDLPQKMMGLYHYNLSMTSNIIGYSTSNIKKFHLNSIIFTHSYKPPFIKKEDCLILSNNLMREHKVFFDKNSPKTWGMKTNSYIVRYGIPKTFKITKDYHTRKDVLILNFSNIPENIQLQRIISKNNYQCDVLNSCTMNTEKLNAKLNEYKICIDLADHNISNLLCAIAAGCQTVTMSTPMIVDNYSNIVGLNIVESPNDITSIIPSLLSTSNQEITNFSEIITKDFDFDRFAEQISALVNNANMEAFVL